LSDRPRDTSISAKPGKESAEIALVIQIGPRRFTLAGLG
jgi:hypothetical protein